MEGQRRGPARLAQELAGAGPQFAQVKLFGHAVLAIKVAARAGETLRATDGRKTAGPIARAPVVRLVHETLHHQHRMLPAFLPVRAQAAQTQPEHARGQIGETLALGQDEEAAVVDDHGQAPGALAGTPAEPRFPRLEMERGGAESNQGDPLAVKFGHIAQRLAGQHGLVQVMLLLQQAIKLRLLGLVEQPDRDALQEIGFMANGCVNHAATFAKGRSKVQSFFIPPKPACIPGPLTNQR